MTRARAGAHSTPFSSMIVPVIPKLTGRIISAKPMPRYR